MSLLSIGRSPDKLYTCQTHSHDCYEVILTLAGSGIQEIEGKDYPFEPGTIHIIPPCQMHIKHSEEGFIDIYFHTDRLDFSLLSESPLTLKDDSAGTMANLMQMMLLRYLSGKKQDLVLEQMYSIALSLLKEWAGQELVDPVVEKIIHRLKFSFNDPEFSITDLLAESGYSKDYIRRRFISSVGVTPGRYLTDLRLNYAKNLLSRREILQLSIEEIAIRSGYYDSRYFSRIFKARTGISPSAWK